MTSTSPAAANRPINSSAVARTNGSNSATRRGVKTRLTATRSRVCTSPSLSVRFGVNDQPSAITCLTSSASGPVATRTALSEENTPGSCNTRATSSCRDTTHTSSFGSCTTGHEPRNRAYIG